jgi:hypothetical protein
MATTLSTVKLPVELDVVWRREGHEPLVVGTITTEIEVPVSFGTARGPSLATGGLITGGLGGAARTY